MKNLYFTLLFVLIVLSISGQEIEGQGPFTIIGKTTGFKDSTILYLKKVEEGYLQDNLDSAYVINNSFIFKGYVTEPSQYSIHTGYTGWEGYPPETFSRLAFWVNNSTIYINDKSGNIEFASISGSQLQADNNDLLQKISRLYSTRDSLTRIILSLSPKDSVKSRLLREKGRFLSKETVNAEISFIKSHPRSIISIYLLDIYKTNLGKEVTKDIFFQLDTQIRNIANANAIKEYIGLPKTPAVGDKFTDIELANLNGDLIKLSSLKNKYILLDFWSFGCKACRVENPVLLNLYNKYKHNGFEIYAVCLDEKKEFWQKAVVDDKINWITVSDLKGPSKSEAALIYNVTAIPHNYLINKKGIIIAEEIRGTDLEKKLEEIFK